jgi:hypothetical protein
MEYAYEADDTRAARLELKDAMTSWQFGDEKTHTRTMTALRAKYHRLRDRDAAVERAVREAIEPTELVAGVETLCSIVETADEENLRKAVRKVCALLPASETSGS